MMGEVETQQARGLADVMTLHQQTFRLIDYIVMYVANGCATRGFMDDVAKVTGRVSQFGGTPGNSG